MSNAMTALLVLLNEAMAVLTLTIVFPGFLPPKDRMEIVMVGVMMIPMSFAWWFFLAVSPIAFGLMWWAGEVRLDYWAEAWPWRNL